MTADELRQRIRALENLPAGVKQTQISGQMVTFRSTEELAREKSRLRSELASVEGRRRKGWTMASSGGLD